MRQNDADELTGSNQQMSEALIVALWFRRLKPACLTTGQGTFVSKQFDSRKRVEVALWICLMLVQLGFFDGVLSRYWSRRSPPVRRLT
jgi:hypothetical protein